MLNIPILMDAQEIEPIVLLYTWLENFDILLAECAMHALVAHITQAIES